MSQRAITSQLLNDLDARPRSVTIPNVTAHITAGEQFSVFHGLGTVPSHFTTVTFTNANTWAEEADRRLWTERRVVLRCSVSAAPMSLTVFE